ncbi:expressed unknown protein [Seminavis robusta]|uniref:Uncharacterized protein n=1 Tax=Seminavis robusta TaxID=568900 RepID=A0A9N8EZI1_9STRA|nr:expressed unknown protein [Seminavis robusta]|eukprot:Sro2746_g336120.1 n/a (279) ;mRNA; r:8502-9453
MMKSIFLTLPFLWLGALSSVSASDDALVAQGTSSNGPLKQLGEVCGNSNPCVDGMECIPLPIRKKCFPHTCVLNAVLTAFEKEGFDLASYGEAMMNLSGVERNSPMFKPFPGAERLDVMDGNSTDMGRFLNVIKDNPPPLQAVQNELVYCNTQSTKRQANNDTTLYYGASWEAGAIATYEGDVLLAQGPADTEQIAVLNNCFGFILGAEAGISGLLGVAFTNTAQDLLEGCKQMIPLLSVTPFSLQVGFIDCEDPTWLVEMTAGFTGGFALPGKCWKI